MKRVKFITLILCLVSFLFTKAQSTLVWSDDFTTDGRLNDGNWDYIYGNGSKYSGAGWTGGEKEYYTNDSKNVRCANGNLIIEAHQETKIEDGYTTNFTSGRVRTRQAWKFCKVEVRAKLPKGESTWPAIWMLPQQYAPVKYGSDYWPDNGEIDIMEHVGFSQDMSSAGVFVEGPVDNQWQSVQYANQQSEVGGLEDAYHTYGLEWYPNRLDFYVDDVLHFSYANPNADWNTNNNWQYWPFDQDFHLILNLAIGGAGYSGPDNGVYPLQMQVDYVKIYDMNIGAPDTQAPSTPSNFTYKAYPKALNLKWAKSTDNVAIQKYELFKNGVFFKSVYSCSDFISGLTPDTSYDFTVKAVDFKGNVSGTVSLTAKTDKLIEFTIPAQIEAESYNAEVGTKLETTTDVNGGFNVGYIDANDWLEYHINVPTAGEYTLDYRVASGGNGSAALVLKYTQDNGNIASSSVANTGGWQVWKDVKSTITLKAGSYDITLFAQAGGVNINWFNISSGNGGGTTPVCDLNQTIEAESYALSSNVGKEACSEGGEDTKLAQNGNWMLYNLDIPCAGEYNIELRVASANTGGVLQLDKDAGATILGLIDIPNTGGSQVWQTVKGKIALPAGALGLGLNSKVGGYNLNWFKLSSVNQSTSIQINSKNELDCEIFPNPISGNSFNLKLPEQLIDKPLVIEVLDLSGKIVFSKSEIQGLQGVSSIFLDTQLSNGFYIISVKSADTLIKKKVFFVQ